MSEKPIPQQTVDPSILAGNALENAEQRRQLESAVGQALDGTFERNAAHIVKNPSTGVDGLTLYIPWREGRHATIDVTQSIDDAGNRTAYMSFSAMSAWRNDWRYTDGPSQERRLEQGKFNDEGLFEVFKPNTEERGPDAYDHNSDKEVAFWGRFWPKNLEGSPEKPGRKPRLKYLGKLAVGRIFNG